MRRADFRKKIDAELRKMGFKPASWIWQTGPARLTICIGGEFKDIPIRANMKKDDLAFQLGRLSGWAEMMDLEAPAPKVFVEATKNPRLPRQIDLEEAIAGAPA